MAIPAILATVAGGVLSSLVQQTLGATTAQTTDTGQSVSKEDFNRLLERAQRQDAALAHPQEARGGAVGVRKAGVGSGSGVGAATLLGKTVMVNGSSVALDGKGPAPLTYTLPDAAKTVKVQVVDAEGSVVRTVEIGQQGRGPHRIVFDGLADDARRLPAGTYTYRVVPTDGAGNQLPGAYTGGGVVTGVANDAGRLHLQVGDRTVPLTAVVRVMRAAAA